MVKTRSYDRTVTVSRLGLCLIRPCRRWIWSWVESRLTLRMGNSQLHFLTFSLAPCLLHKGTCGSTLRASMCI